MITIANIKEIDKNMNFIKTLTQLQIVIKAGCCTIPNDNLCKLQLQQGKSEGFDSCDRPSNLTQTGFKSSIFQPV